MDIVKSSLVAQKCIQVYKKFRLFKIWLKRKYIRNSRVIKYFADFRDDLSALPVKTCASIFLIAILSDMAFEALFKIGTQNSIGLPALIIGRIIKAVLLGIGVAGLSCNAILRDILSTSLFIGLLNRKS